MTVRVAWIFRELRGVVANVDLIAAVRGLAHKEAVHFFSQHKEKWLRTQWMGMERIALDHSDQRLPRQSPHDGGCGSVPAGGIV